MDGGIDGWMDGDGWNYSSRSEAQASKNVSFGLTRSIRLLCVLGGPNPDGCGGSKSQALSDHCSIGSLSCIFSAPLP